MTVIAQKPFLETSDGDLRSISSMLDSCQKSKLSIWQFSGKMFSNIELSLLELALVFPVLPGCSSG